MTSVIGTAKRQKVFLGCQHFTAGLGGIAVVARLSARVLARMNMDVHLLSLLDGQDGAIDSLPWHSTCGNRLSFTARSHLAAMTCDRFLYDSVGTARAHSRLPLLRPPYGLWMHGIEVWYSLHKDRERALRGAGLVLVNSEATLQKFRSLHGDLATAKVCWLATEADEPPAISPDFSGPPTVLVVGSVDLSAFYKGHTELVACWAEVVAAVPDARLVIAGGGSGLEHLRSLVAQSPAHRSIAVKGFVAESDLPGLWAGAHVLAMPSRNEGFGLVYVEAMRHGLPVVASVHDAGREVNVDGETGYNVDLDRAAELPDRLIGLLAAPDLARQMGRRGRERWRQHFRFGAFERRLRDIAGPFFA